MRNTSTRVPARQTLRRARAARRSADARREVTLVRLIDASQRGNEHCRALRCRVRGDRVETADAADVAGSAPSGGAPVLRLRSRGESASVRGDAPVVRGDVAGSLQSPLLQSRSARRPILVPVGVDREPPGNAAACLWEPAWDLGHDGLEAPVPRRGLHVRGLSDPRGAALIAARHGDTTGDARPADAPEAVLARRGCNALVRRDAHDDAGRALEQVASADPDGARPATNTARSDSVCR